jgi:hypothetical protein
MGGTRITGGTRQEQEQEQEVQVGKWNETLLRCYYY